ncbi:MAG: hypothetical protein H8E57_08870, partial [Candidatus Cloacimonetes bacterium]|nr:hypothetical protein [Candidatus Cloacimonadota bacterium]
MISLRRSTQYIIVIMVFGISVFIGLQRSQLLKQTKTTYDTKAAMEAFEKESNIKKIKMTYSVDLKSDIDKQIAEIIQVDDINIKFSESKGYLYTVVFEFPNARSKEIMPKLRQMPGLSGENLYLNKTSDYDINIAEHLKNNQFLIDKTKEEITKSRSSYTDKLKESKDLLKIIQTEIDSLNNQQEILKHNKEYDLLFLTVIKNIKSSSMKTSVKNFVLTTITFLAIFIVGLILFYFIMILLTKLMVLMGIKTA